MRSREHIEKRNGGAIFIVIMILAFAVVLVGKLFELQIVNYDYYLDKVLDNIQRERVISAKRGSIYDKNMNVLATNITVWRVFISPSDITESADDVKIATELSRILGLNYSDVYEKTQKKSGAGSRDQTIKKNVKKAQVDEIRQFIADNEYGDKVFLEEGGMRYYPNGALASQVIGVKGTDSGLFGLELQYDSYMSGTDGVYVTAKNAVGEDLPSEYEKYIEAKDGLNVITTLDTKIQSILENQLSLTYVDNRVGNRVCGVVMDVKTGAILAMATYPDFDLNSPYTLSTEYLAKLNGMGLEQGSEEYKKAENTLIYEMWKNKTVTDTYYPGSTFKAITACIAIQEGVVTESSVFTCNGVLQVGPHSIHCSSKGHGTHDFAYMLQQSCNPTMMLTAQRFGGKTFMNYFENFGYTKKTGIDLPGEMKGATFNPDNFTAVDLAVSSFGQGFTTTVIQQISAICAVANGGYIVTPHIVSSLTDADGNTVVSYDYQPQRQVISKETSERVTKVLEEGVIGGGSKNAYVAGYRVVAKTGTSEKIGVINPDTGKDDMVVGSCVAYAPADDPQIAILIMVDEPNPPSGSRYGGVVAAPYIANALSEILPYIGVTPKYSESEMEALNYTVGNYVGSSLENTEKSLKESGVAYETVGEGNYVLAQVPKSGEAMKKSDAKVILYLGERKYDDSGHLITSGVELKYATVPDVVGNYTFRAVAELKKAGFNVKVTGSTIYTEGTGAEVTEQNYGAGTSLPVGTVIVINSRYTTGVAD